MPLPQTGGLIDRLETFLAGLQTTEGRLAVSGAVILVTLAIAVVVAPRVIRWLSARMRATLPEEGAAGYLGRAAEHVPASLRVVVLRFVQLGLVSVAAVALLLVWGSVDWVIAILIAIGSSADFVADLSVTVVVVILAYVAIGLFDDAVEAFSERADRVTDHQEEILRRFGQLGVLSLAIATGLTIWGVDLSGLLVGAGFLGIVVGLAARQTLGSLIAGIVLMFSRPFTIGDWVEIGGDEGIVTDITIVNTRLENFDGEFVVIPNDTVANQPITNRSRKGHLRIRLDVGVDYASDPDHARDVALEAMDEVDAIQPTPPPQAFLKEFGDSAVVIELRFWIDRPTPPRKWQATNAVVAAVKAAFEAEGIKIPFPQRELSGRAETGGFRTATGSPGERESRVSDGEGRPAEASQENEE